MAENTDRDSKSTPETILAEPWPEMRGPSALNAIEGSFGPLPRVRLRDEANSAAALDEENTRRGDSPSASRVGRYQILGEIARGGMGAVLRGRDTDLNRELAIKVLLERFADDPAVLGRFVEEAQIGGQLQHPGIVPVYELGQFNDQRPFFAMRLVKGRTLAELLNERESPASHLPRFLKIFEQVCETMAYSHSKGVIHRDLKPLNVMVGAFGEVKIVDWGLAKVLGQQESRPTLAQVSVIQTKRSGDGSDLTEHGAFLGTPPFMSPEQARGELDQLDERADVFALGSILCQILTGQPAHTGRSNQEMITKAIVADLDDARDRLTSCGADLELIEIARLCLEKIAEDRPRNASAVARLITSYLAGVQERLRKAEIAQVEADQRATAEKARRKFVAAIAGILVLAACGLATGLVAMGTLNGRLKTANSELDRANAELASKNGELSTANTALDEQRQRAEDREALAIRAVERFRDAIVNEPELKKTPALEELRKRLLNEPLAFFRSLRERLQADRDTRPESLERLAKASFELSYLIHEIGSMQDALIALRKAVAIQQKLADANPTNAKFQSDVARSYNNLGVELYNSGKPAEALRAHESALPIWRKLVDTTPADARSQYELAQSHFNIAQVMSSTGKPAEALRAYETVLTIAQKQAEANPTITEFPSQQAATQFQIGMLLEGIGKAAEALKAYETALTIRQKLADTHPTVTEFQLALAQSLNTVGTHLSEIGKLDESLRAYETARAIRQKLADNNPTDTVLQSELAASHYNIGRVLEVSGAPAEALIAFKFALPMFQKLADANPAVPAIQHRLASVHYNIGGVLSGIGKPAEALKEYESALEILQKLVNNNPTSIVYQSKLATSHDNLGALYYGTGKPDEAIEAIQRGLAIRQKLAEANPTFTEFQAGLGQSEHNIAAIDFNAKRFERARKGLREAVKWERKALESNPANPICRQKLANSLSILIATCRSLGDSAGTAEAERELAELRDSDPAIKALDSRLAAILKGEQNPANEAERLQMAQRAYEKALHKTAATLWREAIDANSKLGDDRQTQHRYNAACAAALAGCDEGKDDPPPSDNEKTQLRHQALDWLKAELDVWSKLLEFGPSEAKPVVIQTLKHWQEDTDLAGIRDEKELTKLADADRKDWQALWGEVETLRKRAEEPKP